MGVPYLVLIILGDFTGHDFVDFVRKLGLTLLAKLPEFPGCAQKDTAALICKSVMYVTET